MTTKPSLQVIQKELLQYEEKNKHIQEVTGKYKQYPDR